MLGMHELGRAGLPGINSRHQKDISEIGLIPHGGMGTLPPAPLPPGNRNGNQSRIPDSLKQNKLTCINIADGSKQGISRYNDAAARWLYHGLYKKSAPTRTVRQLGAVPSGI